MLTNVVLLENRVFVDFIGKDLEVVPQSNDWCSYIRGEDTHTEGHVKTVTKIRVMQLSAKECQGWLGATRN